VSFSRRAARASSEARGPSDGAAGLGALLLDDEEDDEDVDDEEPEGELEPPEE
jgi:hypothetical protein